MALLGKLCSFDLASVTLSSCISCSVVDSTSTDAAIWTFNCFSSLFSTLEAIIEVFSIWASLIAFFSWKFGHHIFYFRMRNSRLPRNYILWRGYYCICFHRRSLRHFCSSFDLCLGSVGAKNPKRELVSLILQFLQNKNSM